MSIEVGNTYTVNIISIRDKGVVVQPEGEQGTEFIHISKISSVYVSDISKFVKVGDTLKAICVSSQVKPAELSLLHLNLRPAAAPHESKGDDYNHKSIKQVIRRQHTPPPTSEVPTTLEDMIKKSNSQFQEHQHALNTRLKRRYK